MMRYLHSPLHPECFLTLHLLSLSTVSISKDAGIVPHIACIYAHNDNKSATTSLFRDRADNLLSNLSNLEIRGGAWASTASALGASDVFVPLMACSSRLRRDSSKAKTSSTDADMAL